MKSCLCCSLLTGCKLVAAYQIVSATLALCLVVVSLFRDEHVRYVKIGVKATVLVLVFLAALALVWGLRKKSPCLLLVWLIFEGVGVVFLICDVIFNIYGAATFDDEERVTHDGYWITTVIIDWLNILFCVLCMEAVRSYRTLLLEEESQRSLGAKYQYQVAPTSDETAEPEKQIKLDTQL
ncbi:hypothetical protein BV898_00392 [Hypsibius exemplaris]|uniref:MARVEL domain-containing protein n=1 Tax=Hypsibius exemplaris TaxID=2072580 RepID=A0A1W0XDN9_HYPEX|nr:hypothetical protein BV898_00392 [Hypsibius exemplaris]